MPTLLDRVELVDPDELIPYSNNPKEHPDEQVKKIASSIKNYGWDQPIVVDGDGEIIKGHGRAQAADLLGLDEVPVIWREDLTDAEAKAARIADNKTAESPWDEDLLAPEVETLLDIPDIDDDSLGFDDDEIDDLLADAADESVEGLSEPALEDKKLEDVRILNLYAGIGGNRKLWGDEPDVTSVEYNEEVAEVYRDYFPDDTVVVDDAHDYLLNHFDEFDFIWASPPCPTHSKMQRTFVNGDTGINKDREAVYPDMRLYQEIILLDNFFDGSYVVENVDSYYDPLIEPQKVARHYFWSDFDISDDVSIPELDIQGQPERYEEMYDYDLSDYSFSSDYPKVKILRNCVHPKLGKHILEHAVNSNL
jgi:DNA (cytosine-5)-methyltransferase 1